MKYVLALIVFAFSSTFSASALENLFVSSTNFKSCAVTSFPSYLPPGPIQIASYGFGGTDTGASGTGKPVLQSLTFSKKFDGCSGQLATYFLTSTVIPQVTVSAYANLQVGPTAPDLTITLSNVQITSYMLADTGTNGAGTEQIVFAFTKACIVTPTSSFCYDVPSNSISQ